MSWGSAVGGEIGDAPRRGKGRQRLFEITLISASSWAWRCCAAPSLAAASRSALLGTPLQGDLEGELAVYPAGPLSRWMAPAPRVTFGYQAFAASSRSLTAPRISAEAVKRRGLAARARSSKAASDGSGGGKRLSSFGSASGAAGGRASSALSLAVAARRSASRRAVSMAVRVISASAVIASVCAPRFCA